MAMVISAGPASAQKSGESNLFSDGLSAFKTPRGDWEEVASVVMDTDNPKKLKASSGKGVWYNGPKGRTQNLFTTKKHGDIEVEVEFMIPKGSNSGIKFHGHYEIQIIDSFGAKTLSGDSCGGVYPRAETKPNYHHIDKGIAPRVNACKAPGEWQSMTISFQAPRFDDKGKKIANARIVKAVLNGQVIHENQELLTPTGDRWQNAEMAEGPLMIQADHGPVAIRKLIMRPLPATK
jgi:hypothetical protein